MHVLGVTRVDDLVAISSGIVGVDMPLGLTQDGRLRSCDRAARERLGDRRSCVFAPPARGVLACPDHPSAVALARSHGWAAPSVQAWNLRSKLLEVQPFETDPRVVEVHPEVSYAAMAGGPLPPKRSAAGRAARLEALAAALPGAPLPPPRVAGTAADDVLDALAVLWSALRRVRGEHEELGAGPWITV